MSSLFAAFEATESACPDAVGFVFLDAGRGRSEHTYAALVNRARRVGRRLAAAGVERGELVGILLETQEDQVLHYLAALSCGAVPAILAPPHRRLHRGYYAETTRAVVAGCRFAALITELPHDMGVRTLRPHTVDETTQGKRPAADARVDGALVQFSSGTTGIKRGVPIRDETALRQIDGYARAIELRRTDRIVGWLPLYHDMGLMTGLNMALACGVQSVMLDPVDWVSRPVSYLEAVAREGGTLGWHPNFAFALMARAGDSARTELDLTSLRGLVNCSEPVTHSSQAQFLDRFARCGLRDDVFWGCYAMAETTFAVTHGRNRVDYRGPAELGRHAGGGRRISVGRPLTGVELRVVGEDGAELPDRRLGELWVRSPFNAAGYHLNPAGTTDAFRDGWYRTGDLGYTVGGELFVCGRTKDLIIVGGVNIHPEDVEAVVSAVPGVHPGRVGVFGEHDAARETERIVVLAEPEEGVRGHALVASIRQRVVSAFQVTALDVALVAPGWLVKSSSGKMARGENRRRWRAEQAALRPEAPAEGAPVGIP